MNTENPSTNSENDKPNGTGRRDMLKIVGAAAASVVAGAVTSAQAKDVAKDATADGALPTNPLRRRAEHRPAIPALLQTDTIRPQPE